MSDLPTSPFVFFSYARADLAFALRLKKDLEKQNIAIWMDLEGIPAASPDWEELIRTAIRACCLVMLIVSPDSRISPYVKDELAIAKMYERPIYPVWAAGMQWMESIPIGRGSIQYTDAREEKYEIVLPNIVSRLQEILRSLPALSLTKPDLDFIPRNPYKGLRAFTAKDTHDFFGREKLVNDLADRLKMSLRAEQKGGPAARMLALLGPSGSGKSSIMLGDLATLPSFLADGDITTLLKGSALETTLADALRGDDYVLAGQDRTYFLGNLLEHGIHSHNAFNDERRYCAQILLLCLACILIPERCFEIRLVTALPVTLYDRERRQRVKQALSQHYCFSFNGRAREVKVTCGYVAMEGQGILIHCGDAGSEQAIIDVGERTTDLVAANGQRLVGRFCKGEQFGIGQLVEDVQQLGQRYRRKLSVEKAHALLTAYAHQRPYPPIAIGTGLLPEQEITETIEGSIKRLARPLTSFLVGAWNVEGVPAGTQFDTIYLGGGGVYYVEKVIRQALEDCHLVTVPDPEYSNICGYAELAASLDEERWEDN